MRIVLTEQAGIPATRFLQSAFWAEFKTINGWVPLRFSVSEDERNNVFSLSILIRAVKPGFSIAYVPHGPAVEIPPGDQQEFLIALSDAVRTKLPSSVFCLRFDPSWYCAQSIATQENETDTTPDRETIQTSIPLRPYFKRPLVKSSDVQPPDSVVISIDKSDDELLAAMKPKWRYNLRLAQKKGVTVESFNQSQDQKAAIDSFYVLYEETGKRDRIALHPKSYYARLLDLAKISCDKRDSGIAAETEPIPDVRVWIARHEGQNLASIITIFFGSEATYLYGAASDEKRNLMPTYLLQWEAMKAARAAGCISYDLYGIPPSGEDPTHAMAGLFRFKTGFGGEIRHYPGCYDIALRPVVYATFRFIEKLRLFWHKTVQKKIRRILTRNHSK